MFLFSYFVLPFFILLLLLCFYFFSFISYLGPRPIIQFRALGPLLVFFVGPFQSPNKPANEAQTRQSTNGQPSSNSRPSPIHVKPVWLLSLASVQQPFPMHDMSPSKPQRQPHIFSHATCMATVPAVGPSPCHARPTLHLQCTRRPTPAMPGPYSTQPTTATLAWPSSPGPSRLTCSPACTQSMRPKTSGQTLPTYARLSANVPAHCQPFPDTQNAQVLLPRMPACCLPHAYDLALLTSWTALQAATNRDSHSSLSPRPPAQTTSCMARPCLAPPARSLPPG